MLRMIDSKRYFMYSELSFDLQAVYYGQIKSFIRMLTWEYAGFTKWFESLFTDDYSLAYDREIILCESQMRLVGIAILKKSQEERKICTLRVDRRFQRQGIGHQLMELSFDWLEDDRPLLTLHRSREPQFRSLLNRYGFKLEQENRNYYRLFSTELAYNGMLPEQQFQLCKFEIADIEQDIRFFLNIGIKSQERLIDLVIKRQIAKADYREHILAKA